MERRSTRLFQETPVPPDVIRRLVHAAIQAPTSCNRQLWHFVIVTDPAVKARMSRLGDDEAQSYLYDAPAIIAVFYDTTMESRNPCCTPVITAGMAIYGLLLAAEAEGLGAIYLGGIRSPRGVAAALHAPEHLQNFGLVCLGYRDDEPAVPERRSVDEVISFNAVGGADKLCHPDIRPHVWKLRQLADFREKILWYKGIGIDGKTLHVNPDPRFSPKFRYMIDRLGMLIARRKKPAALDIFSHNADLALQLLNACAPDIGALYAYDLTEGIADFMRQRLRGIVNSDAIAFLVNPDDAAIRIPLPDNSIDVISCYERLGHFEDPLPLAREMHRVLKPDGTAMVVVSNRFYPHLYRYRRTLRKNYALGRNWDYGPERKFEPKEAATLFQHAGFRIRSLTGLEPATVKVVSTAERLCRKLRWHGLGDWIIDWRDQRFATQSWSRYVSKTLVYELEKR